MNLQVEYEKKIKNTVQDYNEKISRYKTEIHDLEIKNKELIDNSDITRKSILFEDSLFDELSELNVDPRESRVFSLKTHQDSIFKQADSSDSATEKFIEKIKKLKEKKMNLATELESTKNNVLELEKEIKKLRGILREYELKIAQLDDDIQHSLNTVTKLESESKQEIQNSKIIFEEILEKIKEKYSEKIKGYKNTIKDLRENCLELERLKLSEDIKEIEEILNKNEEYKQKVNFLTQDIKSKSSTILKLQDELKDLHISSSGEQEIQNFEPEIKIIEQNELIIKENYPEDYSELLKAKSQHEAQLLQLKLGLENKISKLKRDYGNKLCKPYSSHNLHKSQEPFKSKIKELELKKNKLEQAVLESSEKFNEVKNELRNYNSKCKKLEEILDETREKLKRSEGYSDELEARETEYIRKNSAYSNTDEENLQQKDTRIVEISVIENYDEFLTEESAFEEEAVLTPLQRFKESLANPAKTLNSDIVTIKELEVELNEKKSIIRMLEDSIKNLENYISELKSEKENLVAQLSASNKKIEEYTKNINRRQQNKDYSQDIALHEAKMTLLQAHNQKLETELIISNTNWGEMTNALLKDKQKLENDLKLAIDDCRILSADKEELAKKLNESLSKKKWAIVDIFKRKNRNSNS